MNVEFTMEKVTKNTIRFEEVTQSELEAPKIGSIYVPKSTLGELGWEEGLKLVLTLEIK